VLPGGNFYVEGRLAELEDSDNSDGDNNGIAANEPRQRKPLSKASGVVPKFAAAAMKGAKHIAAVSTRLLKESRGGGIQVLSSEFQLGIACVCFKKPALVPSEIKYLRARDTFDKVMKLSREAALSSPSWEPIIFPPLNAANADFRRLQQEEKVKKVIFCFIFSNFILYRNSHFLHTAVVRTNK